MPRTPDGCLGLWSWLCISQINEDGEEHPITFGSRKLLPREWKYSAIEWEALAIVSGIRHFQTYLEGKI